MKTCSSETTGTAGSVAMDGQEGIETWKSEARDMILLDMSLPAPDGWTAARTIRADPATAPVRLAMATSETGQVTRAGAAQGSPVVHPDAPAASRR